MDAPRQRRTMVSFTIDPDQAEMVKRLAALRRSSASQVLRDALAHYLLHVQRQFETVGGDAATSDSEAA